MNKSELLHWLHDLNDRWEALLAEVGPDRMDQPGVNGDWSMKDLVAHLAGWQTPLTARLLAAVRGEPKPPPPWPAGLEEEDDINAWIYQSNKDRPADEVLEDARREIRDLLAAIESLPDDVRIETIDERFHLPWIGDQRFHVGEFFDHFHDDHEADVRAWLSR
jgi:hypothetical protein